MTSITTTLRRQRGMTPEAAAAAVDQVCRRLRLPTMRAVLEEATSAAEREQLTYQGFLAELLLADCDDRDRAPRSDVSTGPVSPAKNGSETSTSSRTLTSTRHHSLPRDRGLDPPWGPLCLIGDSGTGKSHLLIGLGTTAAENGFRVKFTLATRLVNELVEAADEKQLARTIARYGASTYSASMSSDTWNWTAGGAELLFQVLTEREEKSPVAIAANESFSGWTKTFTDPRLCAAIVDRLTFHGTIIETGTDSYRLAHTRAQLSR